MKKYQQLKNIFKRVSQLQYAQRILMWDEAVMMPHGAQESRANTVATLNRTIQKMIMNKKVKALIQDARLEDGLSDWDQANLNLIEKKHIRATCLPLKLTEESTKASIRCEQAWRKLRPENNWNDFLPYFEKSFRLVKEMAVRESQALGLDPYDAMLDTYSPGFNQKNIDNIFSLLKQTLPPLVQQIYSNQQTDQIQIPSGPFSIDDQKMLGLTAMKALQFDFNRGRLDVSHHPFCSGSPVDVRVTTRYDENEFITSLFGICHETGHALYEQGLPAQWLEQPVGHIDSMTMHESQSLLIEMQVCRSLPYVEYLLPLVINQFGQQPAFTVDNLYRMVTRVQPGLIRVNADEVTYPLHIILRYELEKNLMNDSLTIKDLPAAWDELMTAYLGISTKDNFENGVMQDVHWPGGAFGYFPSYTLGRLMAAQLYNQFESAHPKFNEDIKQGRFELLINWLHTHVHSSASSLPVDDLLRKVTGKPLSSESFLAHIRQRYLT